MAKRFYFIVDDDSDDQRFLVEALNEIGTDVHCVAVETGEVALRDLKLIQPLPDAIFLDLNMPGMNGKECLSELKRTSLLKNIPVVIYSSTSDQNEIELTMKMGAMSFIAKRTDFEDLCDELRSVAGTLDKFEAYTSKSALRNN